VNIHLITGKIVCGQHAGILIGRSMDMYGGERGIRTPDSLAAMPDFESGAFNRALPALRIGKPLIANGFGGVLSGRSIIPKVTSRFSYEATFRRALHLKSRHIPPTQC
jgi:hypothetical protein